MDGGRGGGLGEGGKREILKKIDEGILNSKKKIRDLNLEGGKFPESKGGIVDDMVRQIDLSRVALEKLGTVDGDSRASGLREVVVGGADGDGQGELKVPRAIEDS